MKARRAAARLRMGRALSINYQNLEIFTNDNLSQKNDEFNKKELPLNRRRFIQPDFSA